MPDYALMNQCLYEGKAPLVEQMTKDALAEGPPGTRSLDRGPDRRHERRGRRLQAQHFVCAGSVDCRPRHEGGHGSAQTIAQRQRSASDCAGVLLMGTVRGDLHDIGKNLVCMMAEGAGFEVHDIGVDQSVEKFMAAADKCNPTIIGMSALLTTTMTYMKTVIDGFKAAGRGQIKMAIGGAPISQMFADEIGADGYGANASAAVDLFLRLAGKANGTMSKSMPQQTQQLESPSFRKKAAGKITTTYKILYWQEIPSQIKTEDDDGNEVSLPLDQKFQERIDELAAQRGLSAADDYLAQWNWSDEEDRPGTAQEVADALKAEFEAKANW